ncbi:MAG: hypothetical protein AAF266_05745 [Planctomycetota bacterium]
MMQSLKTRRLTLTALLAFCLCGVAMPRNAPAINIVLDYTLDENNWNWFGGTPEGIARRATLDAAAGFLSEIITNDDWAPLPTLNESFSLTDIFQSSINGLDGQPVFGSAESDGRGFQYDISTTNRSSVGANEYIVYVAALAFDTGTSAHAKAGWDSNDRRNAAGVAGTEFNTWGGRIYFDLSDLWYAGQNPGVDPTDDYGIQDPDKTPAFDSPDDNWQYSTTSDTWKGFDLESVDPAADGRLDLYATAVHELMHALGATTSNMQSYVGVDSNGDFIGPNLVDTFGGPVPGNGGHFEEDLQSTVWGSTDIISEATLDPNSRRGVRKYLTEIDVALLRDLGYGVASEFTSTTLAGDYNSDGQVDAADYTAWRDTNGEIGTGLATDGNRDGKVDALDYEVWSSAYGQGTPTIVPEPRSLRLVLGTVAWACCYAVSARPPRPQLTTEDLLSLRRTNHR